MVNAWRLPRSWLPNDTCSATCRHVDRLGWRHPKHQPSDAGRPNIAQLPPACPETLEHRSRRHFSNQRKWKSPLESAVRNGCLCSEDVPPRAIELFNPEWYSLCSPSFQDVPIKRKPRNKNDAADASLPGFTAN